MIVLQAPEQERRPNAAFSAGASTAFRGLRVRLPERALQESDFDPRVASAARASAKKAGTTTTPLQTHERA